MDTEMKTINRLHSVAVDMRMLNSSGIGTYVESLIPLVIEQCPEVCFQLLGRKSDLAKLGVASSERVQIIACSSPVYSVREQVELSLRMPRDITVFWAPHYNIPLWHRGKLMVTVHDVCHLALPNLFNGVLRQEYARLMFSRVRRGAHTILCDSQFTKRELIRLAAVSEDRIRVVYCGVAERWFGLEREQPVHNRPYVLYVGNVKPHKNVGALVDAFLSIRDRIPHDLVIVGQKTGFRAGDPALLSRAAHGAGRIVFTGRITNDAVMQYVVQASVLVLPSLYEGFGLPPLEAMACGCPTLVSDIDTLREIYGDATIYFDPLDPKDLAEKMLMLVTDSGVCERLRSAGRKQARLYSWPRAATDTAGIIRDVLER
jgi:glycosyltransferase involved in cell wall biosynthesis